LRRPDLKAVLVPERQEAGISAKQGTDRTPPNRRNKRGYSRV